MEEIWDSCVNEPEKIRLTTCYGIDCKNNFYALLTEKKDVNNLIQTFESKTGLFVMALLVGYINDKSSENYLPENKKKHDLFRRSSSLKLEKHWETIAKMVFYRTFPTEDNEYFKKYLAQQQESSENEVWKRRKAHWQYFCSIADAGIEIMIEHYEKNNRIDLTLFDEELESTIKEKIKEMKESTKEQSQDTNS